MELAWTQTVVILNASESFCPLPASLSLTPLSLQPHLPENERATSKEKR